jgi:alpha-glucosidase
MAHPRNKTTRAVFAVSLMLLLLGVATARPAYAAPARLQVKSPDGRVEVIVQLRRGQPTYQVSFAGVPVIAPSRLGFRFKGLPPLGRDLRLVKQQRSTFDQTWTQPWGEVQKIRNHYNELRVALEERKTPKRRLSVVFRVYDDGVGFRYELPAQPGLKAFQIADEETEFALTGPHPAWWIPAYQKERYEYLYRRSPVDKLTSAVHTPLTIETKDGLYLSIHEAALTDYASMTLRSRGNTLRCDLVPWSDGVKVKATTPHVTPWRTIQIARRPGDLITSYLVLNLNEPNKLKDVSWIKPGKYVGIWWGMHIGIYTWGSGPKHGATTKNTLRYIDFAAKHGFGRVLVEGWNVGWDGDWMKNADRFRFTEPHPDFDIRKLCRYAQSKRVKLIGHHETSAGIDNYERQMEAAFRFYNKLGIDAVKTGYVGSRTNKTEWHHGQYMVRHYRKVVKSAARHRIMLVVHEPVKDTGIRRTYPNMMSREGARGQEYNAWSSDGGNPPEHTTILPFTRLLAGPFDFTPGIFDLLLKRGKQPTKNRVNTTLAKQLALYVVIYSPVQMAADLPESYEGQPAFTFIKQVPTDWRETRVLRAKIGDHVTIVRQDRNSEDWYLGSVTDENARVLDLPLSFLSPGKYLAEIYADAPGADWKRNPLALVIRRKTVDRNTTLKLRLAAGGGQAIRFRRAKPK